MSDPRGEFGLIERFFASGPRGEPGTVALGIGDDCALLRPPPGQLLAVSSDMLVEGRHFFAGTDPAAIGHKALAVNLSDLAAMAARPLGFTLAVALPSVDEAWLGAMTRGLFELARRFDCPLIGGDTTRGPLTLSITVFGAVDPTASLRRDAALPDDDLWVTGPLGAAALAVAQRRLGQTVHPAAARRLDWPQPRLDAAAVLGPWVAQGLIHAGLDLSDGLAGDLGHILAASGRRLGRGLGAMIDGTVDWIDPALQEAGQDPSAAQTLALSGGDDYELLFSAAAAARQSIGEALPAAKRIGRVVIGQGILLRDGQGGERPVPARGFDHFSAGG